MKEKTKIILMSLLFILSIASIVTYKILNKEEDTKDAIQFKEEYEALNGVTRENTDKIYTSMDLPKNNPMYYATYEEIYDVLEGTGVKISKIAHGIPLGAEIDYVDSLTLEMALENRTYID